MLREVDLFDEDAYLRLYPGIKDAIAAGTVDTAWDHYHRHGRREGRRLNDLDPDFYLRTYPQVQEAFGTLTPAECGIHYAAYGRMRGYRPNKDAPRSVSPSGTGPFGNGLWTDAPDALDRIDGQEDSGRITDRQAAMLRTWRHDGVLLLDRTAGRDRVEPAALDLERGFAGACPDLLFECPALFRDPQPWEPEIALNPAAALDIHYVSAAIRSLLLGDPLTEALRLLFDNRSLLAASRGFIRPPPTPPRRASALFGCTIPNRFVSVWIALEDGVELTVWKMSHRLPPVAIAERFANLTEAVRLGLEAPDAALASYDKLLGTMLRDSGLRPTTLRLKRGEAVFLHPDLINAPGSVAPLETARCLEAQLCPRVLLPVFAEIHPVALHAHGPDRFMSQFCSTIEPMP